MQFQEPAMTERTITYKIFREATLLVDYEVRLNTELKRILPITEDNAWTLLENHQCSNCPYSSAEHNHCPVALTISDVLEEVDDARSTDLVKCEVTTAERTYLAEVDYQTAVY